MKIHAIIAIYNDRMFLSAMLESIKNHVDSIIVADGAYELYYQYYKQAYPHAKPWSTDGSLQIIKAFNDLPDVKVIRPPKNKPWINQNVKRNALVDAVPNGDWFIVIAADETLHGDIDEGLEEIMNSGCSLGRVPLYNVGLDIERLRPLWHPRFHEKIEGMHYYGTHWMLRDKYNRIMEQAYPIKWTDKFVLVHFKYFKTDERLKPHQEYMDYMAQQGWLEPNLTKYAVKITELNKFPMPEVVL